MGETQEPIKFLQLNVHHSEKVMSSLFNSSLTHSFHRLLIQEPYLNWATHLPKRDPNWHMVPPLMNLDPSLTGDTHVKSVV